MQLPDTLVIATHNPGKLKEFERLFAPLGVTIQSAKALNVPDVAETGLTFVENALIKARHVAKVTGLPAIADDSGLSVEALDGAPGIYSARYSDEGTDSANNAKLLNVLTCVPNDKRQAYFQCSLVFLRHAYDPVPVIAEGRWHGEILEAPQGEQGFGYDPLFWVASEQKTSAELLPEKKNALSHRGQALKTLMAHFTS